MHPICTPAPRLTLAPALPHLKGARRPKQTQGRGVELRRREEMIGDLGGMSLRRGSVSKEKQEFTWEEEVGEHTWKVEATPFS